MSNGFIGSGDIYIERIVAGVPQGLQGPFFGEKFEIKPNVQTKELISKGRDTYGQALDTVNIQSPFDFTLELAEMTGNNFALAMLADITASAQTSGTMATLPVTTAADKWVAIGKQNLGAVITVVGTDGSPPTYVEGTDYLLNRTLGLIKALSTGAIAPADIVDVSGPYGAIASSLLAGGTDVNVRCRIVFDGKNQSTQLPVIVSIVNAVITADSAFDFLANDFNKVNLKGRMTTPPGSSAPFTVELR
jgi:hypothetical protein